MNNKKYFKLGQSVIWRTNTNIYYILKIVKNTS